MKRKLIMIGIFITTLIFGSILFTRFNFSSSEIPQRNYAVVKFKDIAYPFELAYEKGTKLLEALKSIGIIDVVKMYEIENKKLKEVNLDDEITHDATYKVQVR